MFLDYFYLVLYLELPQASLKWWSINALNKYNIRQLKIFTDNRCKYVFKILWRFWFMAKGE